MKIKRLLSSLLIALLLAAQGPMVALADATTDPGTTAPTDQPTTQPDQTTTSTPASSDTTTQTPADPTPATNDTTPAVTPPSPPPAPAPPAATGPAKPTGKAPDYAFNDSVRKWEPTIISCFQWNANSGLWECPAFYWYDPVVGWYHVKQNTPSGAVNTLTAGSADPAATLKSILGITDPANSNTGPGSTNNSSLNSNNNLLAQLINNLTLSNFDASTAASGAANVSGNTNAGNATTGAATVVKNLLNLLNAMWAWTGGGLNYFVDDIFGNHTGDLKLNVPIASGSGGSVGALPSCGPGLDSNDTTGPGSLNTATTNCNNNLAVNSQTNGTINNNVDLLARSGDANASGNTTGGDATSGNATAELNILNLINSAIGAGQSFFGMLNIYGDLNGDILFPGLNLSQAVGSSPGVSSATNSGTGPGSTNTAAANTTNNGNVTNNVTGNFNNNIQTAATTGAANVSGNTSAGSAATGDAQTNTDTFNLFNTSIFGDNAILVLVNDMGHWVGHILGLGDGGSGGALLTDASAVVSNNNTGPGSVNEAANNQTNNGNVTNTVNGTINNNVRAGAVSGDANVSGNTIGGNAKSGNATVAASIANIFGSNLSFKHLFGILIINIMPGAHWFGSVGIDTAAGNATTINPTLVTATQFASRTQSAIGANSAGGAGGAGVTASSASSSAASTTFNASNASQLQQLHATQASATSAADSTALVFLVTALLLMAAAGLFSLDRKFSQR